MKTTKPQTIAFEELPQLEAGQIPVMEHFYTVQGEGKYTGHAAYFIRLAGCDVGCVWCDVKESWGVEPEQIMATDTLVQSVAATPCSIVVITGGEPTLHNLDKLTEKLKEQGCRIHIETSGAHALTGHVDWVCLSPKKFKYPLPEAYQRADELKVVVYNQKDLEWAEDQAQYVSKDCHLLLQPEWSRRAEAMAWIVDYVKQHPRWQISLQTHNYLKVP